MTSTEVQPETWGALGEAMRQLNERQRKFVVALLTGKPGYGAQTRAYRAAGYNCAKASTEGKEAHAMVRNPKIIAAIAEEAKKIIRGVGYAEATTALMNLVRSPDHREHGRALAMVLDRVDAVISKQSIDVVHRHLNADQEALEELRAARELGATREKLLTLFGGNGLARLERLDAADLERRSEKAKVIDGEVIEARG
jgi:phage terminase small subunit